MPGHRNVSYLVIGALIAGVVGHATTALAQTVSREQDIVDLRLGQRVLVDDGSCPTGQIKEVQGSQMTTSGVLRTRKCIPRLGTKKR
ncbi:hypothetical protein V1290_007162 [Bradyrhizobium sp. AZCC 1578]|uniref:DUF6719 family protein n=1 Tax=Bradyrhizobium sp. AZCC 1578 TaxID=3117027 RepID=UPI002FF00676